MDVQLLNDLKRIKLFEGLGDADYEWIAEKINVKVYKKNNEVINKNDEDKDVIFIISGQLKVVVYSPNGREVVIDEVYEGDYVGEMACITNSARTSSVIAAEKSKLAFMKGADFKELAKSNKISEKLLADMAEMLKKSTVRITDLSLLDAPHRVCAEILRLAEDSGITEGRAVVYPVPTHAEIANRVGTTRETVTRILSDLQKKDVFIKEGDMIIISDINILKSMIDAVRA